MPKIKNEYDEQGRWVQERNRVKGAIRRAFRLAPQMKEVLEEARVELPPKLKKDGTPGKKNQVRYRCAGCGELFPQTFNKSRAIQVDHIEPVVPLHKKEEDMTYDELVRGIFCSKDNLQVMCSIPMKKNDGKPSCHKLKTDEENFIRRKAAAFAQDIEWSPELMEVMLKKWKEEFKEQLKEKEDAKRKRKSKKR